MLLMGPIDAQHLGEALMDVPAETKVMVQFDCCHCGENLVDIATVQMGNGAVLLAADSCLSDDDD